MYQLDPHLLFCAYLHGQKNPTPFAQPEPKIIMPDLLICYTFSGSYFQEGEDVKMEMSLQSAFQRSIQTLVEWIDKEVNLSKTQVLFRSYAPVHFRFVSSLYILDIQMIVATLSKAWLHWEAESLSRCNLCMVKWNTADEVNGFDRGGDWNTGGTCHLETLPDLGSLHVSSPNWLHLNIVGKVLSEYSEKSQMKMMDVLNVTYMTSRRKDGHSSLYYLEPKDGPAPFHRQDCSHWCLPGVPDSWNELLYALFLKREYDHSQESVKTSQAPVWFIKYSLLTTILSLYWLERWYCVVLGWGFDLESTATLWSES